MLWFSPYAIVAAYAGIFLFMRVMGMPRKQLQTLAAAPFVGAFMGFLAVIVMIFAGQSISLYSRDALWFVVTTAVNWYLLCTSWLGVWHFRRYRRQVAQLREWTTPPYHPRSDAVRVHVPIASRSASTS